jgi:hypothetical protein
MLLGTQRQQYSGREISAFLTEAGFREIEVKPTFGYWSIVTGVKPDSGRKADGKTHGDSSAT